MTYYKFRTLLSYLAATGLTGLLFFGVFPRSGKEQRQAIGSCPQPSPTPSIQQQEPLAAPRATQIEEDMAQQPDQAPISLVQFSKKIDSRMEAAVNDPELAKKLFDELALCALTGPSQGGMEPVQAICLSHAYKLARIDTRLADSYLDLREKLPYSLVKNVEMSDLLGDDE